ncbi:MAG: SRPBCC family protein [Solirubrobacteraceae bacterium]|nr:SRPBCC family protein [Solirubrobacteraceae bacterium]
MHHSEPGSSRRVPQSHAAVEVGGTGTAEGALVPAPRRHRAGDSEAAIGSPSHGTPLADARGPRPVPVTVWRRVDAPPVVAFDAVVPIDLPTIFRGYGPLPAVVSATDAPGGERWGVEGQSRTVMLAGGGRMEETVLEVQQPGLFRYRVVPVRGPLRLLVRQIEGQFVFARHERGGTAIRWTYVFRPRRGATPLARVLAPLWRRYAEQAIDRIAAAVDAR